MPLEPQSPTAVTICLWTLPDVPQGAYIAPVETNFKALTSTAVYDSSALLHVITVTNQRNRADSSGKGSI